VSDARPPLARAAAASIGATLCVLIPLERFTEQRWHSDDVAWQVAFRTWRPGAETLMLTENTYLLRLPLLLISDAMVRARPLELAALSLTLNIIAFLLILRFARFAIASSVGIQGHRLTWVHEATAAAAALTPLIVSEAVRVNNGGTTARNLEAGLYLLALQTGIEVWRGERRITERWHLVALAIAVALLSLNDPLFAYSIAVPFLGWVALARWGPRPTRRIRPRGLWPHPALGVLAGLALWQVLRQVLTLIGIEQRSSGVEPVSPGDLWSNLTVLADVLSHALGIDQVTSSDPIRWIVGSVVLVALVACAVAAPRAGFGAPALLGLIWLAVLSLLFVITTAGASGANSRYVIVGIATIGIAAGAVAARSRRGIVAIGFVAVVTVSGAFVNVARELDGEANAEAIELSRLVNDLHDDGYTIAYSGYWTAHIVTYYAESDARVLAVICDAEGRTAPFRWLADLSRFESAAGTPRRGSVLIYDDSRRRQTCARDALVTAHGRPDRVLTIAASDRIEVWVYEQDITAQIVARG
jgi:hypothetical protein